MSAQMTEARTSGTVRAHETSAMTAFVTQPSSPACDHTDAPMLMSRNRPAALSRMMKAVRAPRLFGMIVVGMVVFLSVGSSLRCEQWSDTTAGEPWL